ncbi:MAG: hypothetical protein ACRC33_05620 [Gemmataceae bacterium]
MALSLDALLVNGLSFGVLQPAGGEDFLHGAAGTLLADLASLEARVRDIQAVAVLRGDIEELTGVARGLITFREQPLPRVRAAVGRLLHLRTACLRHLQGLGAAIGVPEPSLRPTHAASSVDAYLGQLDDAFFREWSATPSGPRR